jgi:hypothetical protein
VSLQRRLGSISVGGRPAGTVAARPRSLDTGCSVLATTWVLDCGNLLGTETEGGVARRLWTSNGPVKSSCVIPGKITKPTSKSDMPLDLTQRIVRRGTAEIITARERPQRVKLGSSRTICGSHLGYQLSDFYPLGGPSGVRAGRRTRPTLVLHWVHEHDLTNVGTCSRMYCFPASRSRSTLLALNFLCRASSSIVVTITRMS